jgi:hypothetical protein
LKRERGMFYNKEHRSKTAPNKIISKGVKEK